MAKSKKLKQSSVPVHAQTYKADSAMRILANHLIDRFLENNKDDLAKGLIVNKQKDILIMEHK